MDFVSLFNIQRKIILSVLLIGCTTRIFCQSFLCEENSRMYSICYKLDSLGNFNYRYSHCTGALIGSGKYKITRKKLYFYFDSIKETQIIQNHSKLNINLVKITLFDILDSNFMYYIGIKYNNQLYYTDTSGTVKLSYTGGPIVVYSGKEKDSIILNPDKDSSNQYDIYCLSAFNTFMESCTVKTMVKSGNRYKLKENALGYSIRKNKYYKIRRITFYIFKVQ